MRDTPSRAGVRYTLWLLFLINFLNFFDRTIPAVVLEPLRKEFALDDTALGLLGTSFTLVYALAGLPLGRLADRWRRTRVLAGGVFAWSLMTAASGVAWSFFSFFAIRLGVGVGEASCAPAANSMIGDMYPSRQRARALGLFMLGLPLGSLACFSLVGQLAQKYGWRTPFLLASAPGFVVALLILACREPARGSQEAYDVDPRGPPERPYRQVLAVPTLWWIILSGASVNFAAYALSTFLPALLVRYHHASVARAGGASAIVLGVSGLVGLSFGGWVADRLHGAFPRGRLLLGAYSLLLAAPLLWLGLGRPAGDVAGATALLAFGWLLYFMYFVTVYASVQDVVGPRLRATAMSVYFFFQYVLGAGFGTVVTGALSDHFAKRAMRAAGADQLTEAMRATGLQESLVLVIPLAILLTGVALWFAAGRFVADAARASAGARAGGEPSPAAGAP
ncbi:MAG TPA: MFS transporter [Polyangiaceae bacterium]|nr:MFS transporter [Polyangiaceae bacterium]